MGRQINKEKVLEVKSEVVNYTLFKEVKSAKLDWLLDVYKQDPYKARVLYFSDVSAYHLERSVVFERTDGSFEVCNFRRKFGVSKTNRIYSRETKVTSLIYKNKKLYFKQGSIIKHANYQNIRDYFNFAYDFLETKFAWLRNVKENNYCHSISLSSIITYKLFNAEKILKHIYKAPTPVVKILTEKYSMSSLGYETNYFPKRDWDRIRPFLINIENLKLEFFKDKFFSDTVSMAIKLDKRVNCSWSLKRLKSEHDIWSRELTKIILEFEPKISLNPVKIFEDFEILTGYKLLRNNHDLIDEGRRMDHCVAGYSQSVQNGLSGIYQVSGYTLELIYSIDYSIGASSDRRKKLRYSQLRGFRNSSPPTDLDDQVKEFIKIFNVSYDYNEYEKHLNGKFNDSLSKSYGHADLLPF